MTRRRLVLGFAVAALALAGAGTAFFFVSRFAGPKPAPKIVVVPIPVKPAPQAAPAGHISTIIDAPGDPALVRRTALKAPREISLTAPVKLGGPAEEASAFLIEEPLTPASGGFLGKFAASGVAADGLNVELDLNGSEAGADDDDGGELTPEDTEVADRKSVV